MQTLTKKYIFLLLALFSPAALPAFSHAAAIAIITRQDIPLYATFIDGYKAAFAKSSAEHHSLQVFAIDPNTQDQDAEVALAVTPYNPDILVCIGTSAVKFAQAYFPKIPLIYCMVLTPRDIAGQGRKGMLGVSMDVDMGQKFEALLDIRAEIKKVGAVYDPAEAQDQVREAMDAAKKRGITFDAIPVSSPKEAVSAIETVISRVDAFILFYDKTVLTPQAIENLFAWSFRYKVPVVGLSEKYVALGALFSLESRMSDLARETWKSTEICLADADTCRGVKKTSASGKLVINKKIADKMGLKIPEKLSARGSLVN